MTLDEVMALSNEELRIKAAELDGWTGILTGALGIVIGIPSQGHERLERWRPDADEFIVPDYPNDIAAAWGLSYKAWNKQFWSHVAGIVTPEPSTRRYLIYAVMPKVDEKILTRAFILAMTQEEACGS